MYKPSMTESFSQRLQRIADSTVAVSGDWRIVYENDQYKAWYYGNLRGIFQTPEEVLQVIPEYRRELINRQLDQINQPEQMTLFDAS